MSRSTDVNVPERAFTPVFHKLRGVRTRFVLNYGGSGSSKSWSQAQYELLKCIHEVNHTLVVRKVADTLTHSVITLIRENLIQAWGMEPLVTEYNKNERRITFQNGSTMIFKGMDDRGKIKSIENVTRVWVEEADQLLEEDHRELNRRLRGTKDPQITYTFNPVSERHWLKTKLYDAEKNLTAIHSTHEDNPYLTDDYREELEKLYHQNYNDYRIYVLGHWGKLRTGSEFYMNFDGNNVGKPEYREDLPLHITYDFNVQPYMTLLVFQIEGNCVFQVDEFTPSHPYNNTEAVTKIFRERYGDHPSGVFVYGDPSGKSQDTRSQAGHNDYALIFNILSDHQPRNKVLMKAPPVASRGQFINALLSGWNDWQIIIHEDCTVTTEDLHFVKQDMDGTKVKQKEKDKETGISYEMYGHASDALDYFLCSALASEWNAYTRGGKSPTFVTQPRTREY